MSKIQHKYDTVSISPETVLDELFWIDPYSGGELEQLQARVKLMEELLRRHLLPTITSAAAANVLAGWERYESANK